MELKKQTKLMQQIMSDISAGQTRLAIDALGELQYLLFCKLPTSFLN